LITDRYGVAIRKQGKNTARLNPFGDYIIWRHVKEVGLDLFERYGYGNDFSYQMLL